jgi:hypothetical protein
MRNFREMDQKGGFQLLKRGSSVSTYLPRYGATPRVASLTT